MNQQTVKPAGSLIERAAATYGLAELPRSSGTRAIPEPPPAFAEPRLHAPVAEPPAAAPPPPAPADPEPAHAVDQTANASEHGRGHDVAPKHVTPEPAPAHPVQTPAAIDRAALAEAGMIVPGGAVSVLAEEFRLVKRQLLLTARKLRDEPAKARTILVASARPDEGKTFCAINLALSIAAERDIEVLLIDGDFAKRDLMPRLGLANGPGFLDLLADPARDPETLVTRTDVPQLSVLGAGTRANDDTELLASDRTRIVLEQLLAADRERLVIFDSPPALAASPASVFALHAGQVMLVVRADTTSETEIREAVALLDGCAHIQLVLNQVRHQASGYRFGDYYAPPAADLKKLGSPVAAAALVAGLLASSATPVVAQDRTVRIAPYIEAAQVLAADLSGGGDVLTYTQLSAGIDATVTSRRVTATIAGRYDHNFGYSKRVADEDVVTGLAKVSAAVAPGFSIDGGAIATRARNDIRGAAPGLTGGNLANTSQIVSADIGPSLATHAGPVGIAASYRFGGTYVSSPTPKGLPADARAFDDYSSSRRHLATVSAGLKPGDLLPVGLSASGAYEREDADQLDQKYEGYYGRGDVVAPVSRTVALTAGAGYEKIEIGQRDPVVDGAGNPVTDRHGRFVTDKSTPRRLAFDTRGLFWDAGVLYRPNPRTTAQVRVGRRYDSMTYVGSLAWQASPTVGVNVGVYDSVQSFGRQLRSGVAALPNAFSTGGDPLGQNFNGCVFGQSNAQAGGCLNSSFQSISTANYRARGVDAVLVAQRGRNQLGFGVGYANRKFLLPDTGPNLVLTDGTRDQSFYAQGFLGRTLDANSGFDVNVFANAYDSGVARAKTVYSAGASAGYYHRFGNLGATAAVGVFGYDSAATRAQVQAQARIGLRYGF